MSRIAIVGGHGKIARLLIPLLVDQGHLPVALVRNPEYAAELEGLGAEVTMLDIEQSSVDDFAEAFTGADGVVFAAGGGPDGNIERKRTVDLEGSLKSIDAATTTGARRFVQISAIAVDEPVAGGRGDVWEAYVRAKRDADTALRSSDLEWTIIRPGALTDDDPTGRITLDERVDRARVSRADVAALVAAVLGEPATIGKQWEVVGGDVPIAEAIAAAVS